MRSTLTDEGPPSRIYRQRPPQPPEDIFAKQQAKRLRRDMTDVEKLLWHILRDRRLAHLKFRRQVPVGRYIVDFMCYQHRLVIELDGSQHANSEHDRLRDTWLRSQGFEVLRFWNIDALQSVDGVVDAIVEAVRK